METQKEHYLIFIIINYKYYELNDYNCHLEAQSGVYDRAHVQSQRGPKNPGQKTELAPPMASG